MLERSLEQVIALSKKNPNDFYFQDSRASKGLDLADCLTWLASEKVAEGLADEANTLYERALGLYRETLSFREKVSRSDPSSAFAKYGIAVALERISTTLQLLQRQSETLEPANRSLKLWEELQALAPTNTDYRRNILIISQLIGDIYWESKDYDAANVPYQKGLKTVESLISVAMPSDCFARSRSLMMPANFPFASQTNKWRKPFSNISVRISEIGVVGRIEFALCEIRCSTFISPTNAMPKWRLRIAMVSSRLAIIHFCVC